MSKEGVRQRIFTDLNRIAEEVTGAVGGGTFKCYVFALLFYKWLSDRSDKGLDDSPVPPAYRWKKLLEECNSNNIRSKLKATFKAIEQTKAYRGIFKLVDLEKKNNELDRVLNDSIIKILRGLSKMTVYDEKEDVFGLAYQHLVDLFTNNAGRFGGDYFTPSSIASLLSKLVVSKGNEIRTIYDPTCGSGGLLIALAKRLPHKTLVYGQDINPMLQSISRMNLLINGVDNTDIFIETGDTLKNDVFKGMEFDAIVSNPPFSLRWDSKARKNDPRFNVAGELPPGRTADMAFVLHCLHHLKKGGKAAIVIFPGALTRTNQEQTIRKWLLTNNYIDAVIDLSENLFLNTTVGVSIVVLDKNKKDSNVLFIDAKELRTIKPKQHLMEDKHIEKILEEYNRRENSELSLLLSNDEIIEKYESYLNIATLHATEKKKEANNSRIYTVRDRKIDLYRRKYNTESWMLNCHKWYDLEIAYLEAMEQQEQEGDDDRLRFMTLLESRLTQVKRSDRYRNRMKRVEDIYDKVVVI